MELVSAEGMVDSAVSAASITTELILQYIRAMQSASSAKVKTLHRRWTAVEALEFGIQENYSFVGVPLGPADQKAASWWRASSAAAAASSFPPAMMLSTRGRRNRGGDGHRDQDIRDIFQ